MTRTLPIASLFTLLIGSTGHAQFTVPDSAFAARLNFMVPLAMNGAVLATLHPSVQTLTSMYVPNAWIYDLDGIQYFTGLQYLVCSGNYLTTMPPLPDAITQLECGGTIS
ncbi:MAG: hypothetical protein IPK99_10225 [Flavobacteriales bacterium]|nr:hypothetical protein [Flavobacteriales bacterium]